MNAQEVVDLLKQGVVSLSFTKVKDGAVRNMLATLRADLIPEDKIKLLVVHFPGLRVQSAGGLLQNEPCTIRGSLTGHF